MIRTTVNQTILGALKAVARDGQSRELALAGATEGAAVMTEVRDVDARAAYSTTIPSDDHNGSSE